MDTEKSIVRDDWNTVLDNGRLFSDFCPDWRNAKIWDEWTKYATMCFGPGA
jgi:hypothetical protein